MFFDWESVAAIFRALVRRAEELLSIKGSSRFVMRYHGGGVKPL
jgi:hypothetical protein